MAKTQDPKQLERRLERNSMPPDYQSASDYTRLQQFQARVVETMATEEGMLRPSKMEIGSNHTMAVDFRGDRVVVDDIEVEVCSKSPGAIPFTFSVEDPKEVAKYVTSFAYLLDVNVQLAFLDFSIDAYIKAETRRGTTPLAGMYRQVISLLSDRPKVFKKVYGDSIARIHCSAQPILPIISTLEDQVLDAVFNPMGISTLKGYSKRYATFEQAYDGALVHLRTLE